ncbi:MAG: hypothetical protein R3E48_14790 [Burkholderiaceae bacterium]
MIRAIRDYFSPDIGEILIDTEDIFEQARQFHGPRDARHGESREALS